MKKLNQKIEILQKELLEAKNKRSVQENDGKRRKLNTEKVSYEGHEICDKSNGDNRGIIKETEDSLTVLPGKLDPIITEQINKKLNNRLETLEATLLKVIDEKCKPRINLPSEVKKPYATIVTKHHFENENVTKEPLQGKTQLIDGDGEARLKNIIIHGAEEQLDDNRYVENLMDLLAEEFVITKSIERIGRPDINKRRPIKITLWNKENKEKIMKNLFKLKGNKAYESISIRDDYTMAERNMIKQFVLEAKKRNESELENSNFRWRVFGKPSTTLVIRRTSRRSCMDNNSKQKIVKS